MEVHAGSMGEAMPSRSNGEIAVEMRRRRQGVVVLAGLTCAAVAVLGFSEQAGRRPETSVGAAAEGSGAVLQQLLHQGGGAGRGGSRLQGLFAFVEKGLEGKGVGFGGGLLGGGQEGPVVLEEKAAKPPCTGECLEKKKEIAARMKALRDQINADFQKMTDFGKEVGTLPPPTSIREQVMSGSMFKSKDIKAPSAFDPSTILQGVPTKVNLSDGDVKAQIKSQHESEKAGSTKAEAAPESVSDKAAPSAAEPSVSVPEKLKDTPLDDSAPVVPKAVSSDSTDSDDMSTSSSSVKDSKSGAGNAAWEKAFAFMKHTTNPVEGDDSNTLSSSSSSQKSSTDIYTKTITLPAFKDVSKEDKFLESFDNPVETKAHTSKLSEEASSVSSLKKGSNPLKDAESDKFLAGFLGR